MENISTIIDALHLEDLKNKMHPSVFDKNEHYNMLIIRIPLLLEEEIQVKSMGFIITKDGSYYYNKDHNDFESYDDKFESIHKMLNPFIDKLLKKFVKYQDHIGDMEDNLYEASRHEGFLTQWLGLKRDILHIERILLRTSLTIQDLIDSYKHENSFPENHYLDLHEHIERVLRSATFQLSKLDYLYNFHNVRTNEKMNRMVYLLTVISAIFLPLNLAVGFFGMNTSGLPFTSGSNGTWYALSLLSLSLLATIGILNVIKKRHVQ